MTPEVTRYCAATRDQYASSRARSVGLVCVSSSRGDVLAERCDAHVTDAAPSSDASLRKVRRLGMGLRYPTVTTNYRSRHGWSALTNTISVGTSGPNR